jgi:hypothetical protein
MAQAMKKESALVGGLEGTLTSLGVVLLVIGTVGALAAGSIAFDPYYKEHDPLWLKMWIAIAVASLVQGVIAFAFFRGMAEVIRLLKKANGLEYGGKVSVPTVEYQTVCSACGVSLTETEYDNVVPQNCPGCHEALTG